MDDVKIYRAVAKLRGGIDLFYLDTKTAGPVILCLHGRWGRAETWYDFIKHYGHQYRIIAPDQRGHGLSSKPVSSYTAEEMADDSIELLRYLHIESVILVGHSMGGRIAGYVSALHPKYVKALALLDKSSSASSKQSNLPPERIPAIDPLTKDWPMPFASLHEAAAFIKEATDSELAYEYFMSSLHETTEGYSLMSSPQAIAANIANEVSWHHLLPQILCPVLLMRSSSHEAVPDEAWAEMQSRLHDNLAFEIPHPNHNVHLSCKDMFYQYFDTFLEHIRH